MAIRGLGTGVDLSSSHQSSTVSDADTLRFGAVIGSIGTILTGDLDVDAADGEDQDYEKRPADTEAQSVPLKHLVPRGEA